MPVDITDVSNNNLHLTNVNNVVYGSEGLASFYDFDGTNHLEYPDATIPEFNFAGNEAYIDANGVTIMCWSRRPTDANPASQINMVSKSNSPSNLQYNLTIQATGNARFGVSTTGTSTGFAEVPAANFDATEWNFFCGRWDAGSTAIQIYHNDTLYDDSNVRSAPLFNGNAKFAIGARFSGSIASNFWDGQISRVGVYASALSDDQILTIYEMTAPLFKASL